MVSDDVEYELLGNVLDGLDDLYDLRPRSVLWMKRLLTATGIALAGTAWEEPMTSAAAAITRIMRDDEDDDAQTRQALTATDNLRLVVAERWAELDGQR